MNYVAIEGITIEVNIINKHQLNVTGVTSVKEKPPPLGCDGGFSLADVTPVTLSCCFYIILT